MDLINYLQQNNIWHKFIDKPETIHTKDASIVSGIDLERITKSLILSPLPRPEGRGILVTARQARLD